jgi:hypothetical protein
MKYMTEEKSRDMQKLYLCISAAGLMTITGRFLHTKELLTTWYTGGF